MHNYALVLVISHMLNKTKTFPITFQKRPTFQFYSVVLMHAPISSGWHSGIQIITDEFLRVSGKGFFLRQPVAQLQFGRNAERVM